MKINKDQFLKNFECQKCGNCCKRKGGVVYVLPAEIIAIAEFLDLDALEFREKRTKKDALNWDILSNDAFFPECFLNENNECLIYPCRPKACRTYPDWDYIWQSKKNLVAESKLCPGLAKILI